MGDGSSYWPSRPIISSTILFLRRDRMQAEHGWRRTAALRHQPHHLADSSPGRLKR